MKGVEEPVTVPYFTGHRPGIGADEEFRIVEAMPLRRIIGTPDLVAIELSRPDVMDQDMPDITVLLFQPDDVGGGSIGKVEEKEKNLLGMFGKEGKVHPLRSDGSAARVGSPRRSPKGGTVFQYGHKGRALLFLGEIVSTIPSIRMNSAGRMREMRPLVKTALRR